MTGYDGPRASGSPPDPNAFSALRWSYAPTATASAGAPAILPSISLVRAVQVKAFGSGGEPINKVKIALTRQHVLTDSSADARGPTTSAVKFAIVLVSLVLARARSWSIERNNFLLLTFSDFVF